MNFRIGHSTDIHQLDESRPLILGGINIPHSKGLIGHSDADALLHVISEAMIGALALGDLGSHFPDTDQAYKDVDSKVLLNHIFKIVKEKGYRINNLDCTIFAERPKMAPYISHMRETVAELLETELDNINIKATRGEKMGFIGREEGIACEAVILLIKD